MAGGARSGSRAPLICCQLCHWFGEGPFGGEGGASCARHLLFLVVNKMRIVIFNFPSVLYQHYHYVFLLERMLINDAVAIGFPERCFVGIDY